MAKKKTTRKKSSPKKAAKTPARSSKKQSNAGMFIFLGIIIAVVVLIVVLISTGGGPSYTETSMNTFAQCLTESGTVMYGTFWCPHCAKTKKKFGSAFQYIDYVECDPKGDDQQAERCLAENIERYDTWVFPDGSRFVSEPSFELLSERSGCPMPQEEQ